MVNGSIVFAGSNYRSKDFSAWDATGTEYVSFTEGPLTFQDKVCYTFTLYGSQKESASLQYRAGTPSRTVAEGTLSSVYGYNAQDSEVGAGYGNTYAFAEMDIEGATYRIQAD